MTLAQATDITPGSTDTATITAKVPSPSGVCVPVTLVGQSRDTQGNATLVSTDASGLSTWTFDVKIPVDAPAGGRYDVEDRLLDCPTGTDLGSAQGTAANSVGIRIRS
jgi:hypothetical protein